MAATMGRWADCARWVLALIGAVTIASACGDDDGPHDVVSFDMGAPEDACAACPEGTTCTNGTCVCPSPLELCGGECVDPTTDVRHCGGCGNECSTCTAGVCRCDPGLELCASPSGEPSCADLATSTSHCGACGTRCAAGGTCAAGACACPATRIACPDDEGRPVCIDPMTSVLHCGSCGAPCGVGFDCVGGACACPAGRTPCDDAGGDTRCVELASDDAHCGACGAACGPAESCFDARCEDDCPTGVTCETAEDCRNGEPAMLPGVGGTVCRTPETQMVMLASGPVTLSHWQGGYCMDHLGGDASTGVCNGAGDCNACARCEPAGVDETGAALRACQRKCDPTTSDWTTTRSGCRDGYQCSFTRQVCVPGCTTDAECRATWFDLDNDDVRDANELVDDPTSVGRCDTRTGRCVDRPFNPDARFGDACTQPRDCPEDGLCFPWGDGSCVRFGCNLPGRECGPDATCREYGGGYACFEACVAGDETGDAVVGAATGGDPDCRQPHMRCYSIDGTATGGCEPAMYNDITVPNVGEPCTMHEQCWSPYGNGTCFIANGLGFCTVTQCGISSFSADGITSSVCPPDSFCDGDPTFYSQCVRSCDPGDPSVCPPGFICRGHGRPAIFGCAAPCRTDADCRPVDRCMPDGICDRPGVFP